MKSKFQELIKSIGRRQKQLRDPQIMHPERDWMASIILVTIIFLGSGFWGTHIYLKNSDIDSIDVDSDTLGSVVYRESLVKSALDLSAKREDERRVLTAGFAENVDTEEIITVASSTQATIENQSSSTKPVLETASSTEE